ncbi:MAG: hypothetical protein IJI49_02590 [Bacilli bacterium]|nr:hypothetical protein [Bacilli bacterium]
MKSRQTINSDNFETIFINKEDILSEMASSLTKENINIYINNITSNKNNPNKLKYIITMPKDNIIVIKNTKNNKERIINLTKR